MVTLPNGCYCSEFSVFPKNWKQSNASTKKDWYINYRFYDPTVTDGQGKIKPKQCIIKGMNRFKLLAERRQATQALMEEEMILLSGQGFNPITRQFMSGPVEPSDYEISPSTAFIPALKKALEKLTVTNRVRIGIKSIITGMDKAAMQLRFSNIEISKITRRHIKMMLEQCGRNSKQWSAARYNTYRGYLMMLYKELVELEAVPGNPIRDISKKPVAKRIKEVLSAEDRKRVNDHLANEWPEFQHFVHLFFHSGGRKTELLQLKPGMVDLVNQKYKCVVKKRRQYEEVERTIKTIAIPYWEYFLKNCPDDHFLFGPLFKPGKNQWAKVCQPCTGRTM